MAGISFSLAPATLSRMEKFCYDERLSRSKLADIAINYFLDEEQQDKDDAELAEEILKQSKARGEKPLTTEEMFSKFETKK